MRLIEVVMLMGAHCVSPVEHTGMTTDATKVHCAVVMEKDTERGTLTVTPREAARDPLVAAAAERFRLAPVDGPGGTRIVPAWGPAGSPATEIKRAVPQPATAPVARATAPPPPVAQPPAVPPAAAEPPVPEQRLATLSPPPPKANPAKPAAARHDRKPAKLQATAPKPARQCKGTAVAKWYTAADGRKKYRCVKPGGGRAPDQLY